MNRILAWPASAIPNRILAQTVNCRCTVVIPTTTSIGSGEPPRHGRQPLHDHGRPHITILPDGRTLIEAPEYVEVRPTERAPVEALADAGLAHRAIRDGRIQADKLIEDARNRARNNLALLIALLDDDE